MRWASAFLIVLAAIASVQRAQASSWSSLAEPAFIRIDVRELPESVVQGVAQDRTGFLWVATQGGLARYDGYHFKSYVPNASDPRALPDGYVRCLLAAGDGGLWIGTDSTGLAHFDAATETFRTWRPDLRGKTGPRSATVYALAQVGGGGVWIGGDAGLDYFDPSSGAFTPIDLGEKRSTALSVRRVLVDRSGAVWIATDDGLFRRKDARSAVERVALDPSAREPIHVRSLYEDSAGRMWAGAFNTLYVLERGANVWSAMRSSPPDAATLMEGTQVSIIETTPGKLWVGSSDAGFSIVDAASRRVRRISADPGSAVGLPAGRVWQFLRDRSGLIWIANYSGGLLLYNPFAKGMYVLSPTRLGMGETGADVLALLDGRLYIGGTRGVLVGIKPGAPPVRDVVFGGSNVFGLSVGSQGQLWIGLNDRLCVLYRNTASIDCANQPYRPHGRVLEWTVLETKDAIWYGTGAGVYEEDKRTHVTTIYRQGQGPHDLSSDLAGVLYRDRAGYVWVGTGNGLNRIDPHTKRVAQFTFDPKSDNTFGPGSIETIIQDRSGRLWVAVNGGPLNVLDDPDGHPKFLWLDRANGLPHQNVDGLKEDAAGAMWASTDGGIARIDEATLKVRAFGVADGVLGAEYWGGSQAQAPDGTIFFGSVQGVSVIAPGASSHWAYDPPIVLTSLRIADRSEPLGTTVQLPPGNRDITAEFAALDYSGPQAVQYQYKLDGYDRNWISTDTLHRIATYTNLGPGSYTLRVRATNRLGVWSAHDLALEIDALPAWWETWWFRILAIVLVALGIFGLLQLRTAALQRRGKELEQVVRDRTLALEEASVSDPLTGLKNRRFLTQTIERDAALAMREGNDLLFFMIDIDHFKAINDTYGHHAGDTMLVQMRERLEQVFRDADYLVRWGGEEFLAVARGSSRSDAPDIAERVRREVKSRPFDLGDGRSVETAVSIGFAAYPFNSSRPMDADWQRVVDYADRALYAAKQSGRNTWRGMVASPSGEPRIVEVAV